MHPSSILVMNSGVCCFAEVPLRLSAAAPQHGNSLDWAVLLHPLNAEIAVLIGNTVNAVSLSICSAAVGKTDRQAKFPALSGECVP